MTLLVSACVLVLVLVLLVEVPSARADFGLVPSSTSATALNRDGTIDEQAGSHPAGFAVGFVLKTDSKGKVEGGNIRDALVDLPSGLFGNPTAVPACPRQDFEGEAPQCPIDTQVGILDVDAIGIGFQLPIYNVVPPPGVPAMFGFSLVKRNVFQFASLRSEAGYALRVASIDVPVEITEATETIWGVPADPANDPQRYCANAENTFGCSSTAPLKPYLTMPTSCQAPLQSAVQVDSQLDPGNYFSEPLQSLDAGGNPAPLTGCDAVPFNPKIVSQPTTRNAGSPSGLEFELALPNEGLLNPGGIAESEPSKVVVALPEGLTANPSFAEGIAGCSEAQYHAEQLEARPGEGCPETSKLGSVIAYTPLLEEPAEGSLYLATPYQNQFGSLLAIYMVLRAPERGILIKQAGHVEPNPVTGQLVTTFENLPPLPYNTFHLHFREGARAPLATPPACGTYETVTHLTPFSSDEAVERDASFQIEHGVEGGACPATGIPPFTPGLTAGTANNAAGAYSPLDLRITRKDGEQEITGFTTELPEGLTANLNGIPFCTPAQIAAAQARSGKQTGGAEELASLSCPAASQIGHTQVGVGVGTVLAYAPGNMYLGGPFEGAPFSIVSISAAKVGPFDLGTVVVHLPLDVDPTTARVSIPQGPADQIPHIIDGIIVHVRDIQVQVDREHFTINPTSCEHTSIAATVYGSGQNFTSPADDVPATTTTPFQAANCASLAFKPGFEVSTSGKTSRKDGASLKVRLTYPNAPQGTQANVRSVHVELPRALPSRLNTLNHACPAATFAQNPAGCSAQSRVGYAKATTPILPVPVEGPAYFVSHGGQQFPELIVVLQGDGVTIDLAGETFINEKTSITSSTFKQVPDVPVGTFELNLPQGEFSALGANTSLCATSLSMPTVFTAQNGMVLKQNTPINVENCPYTLQIVKKRVKKRTVALTVSVPDAGKLTATGHGLKTVTKSSKARQTITLSLKTRHAGTLRTKIHLRFTPSKGKQRKTLPASTTVTIR
ncbi:MAG TPA: hypothetical protein VFW38_05420 [Solirubrobacteraceae bacterium]|nr:hypothetical protein [Solirubrobacteraceae bacterium]